MSEENVFPPFVSVDFGESGGRMEWKTFADIQAWLTELQGSWSWLPTGWAPNNNAWNIVVGGLSTPLQQFQQAETYRTQDNPAHFESWRVEGKRNLESFIRSNPWVLFKSPKRAFVFDIKDSGKVAEAGLIVAHWIGVDMGGAPTGPVVWALLQSEFYQRGIKDRVKNESVALKSLVADLQTKLTEFREEERTQVIKFNETHGELVTQSGVQQGAFDEAQTGRKNSWETQVDAAETELKRIKDTYDNFMSLAAPVMYWQSKQRRHRWWMAISGFLVVASMFLIGAYLHSEINSIGKAATVQKALAEAKVLKIEAKASAPATSASAPTSPNGTIFPKIEEAVEVAATWRLGSFIVLATLCFWFLRLLVRVFLSNMHLENDAAERVTMAQTYLALLRKGRLPEKEDISMVLAALFRPSGDGLVKDEGVPPSFLEMLTKLGSR